MDEKYKKKTDRKSDILFTMSLLYYSFNDGKKCKKCGIVQGDSYKGWKRYYCKHLEAESNKFFKKLNDECLRDAVISTEYFN